MWDFFKTLGKVVFGLGSVVLTVFPEIGVPKKIVDALPGMIAAVEAMGGDGPVKKEAVLKGAELLAETGSELSTGGQKETWEEKVKPNVGKLVDAIVAGVNQARPGTIDETPAAAATAEGIPSQG